MERISGIVLIDQFKQYYINGIMVGNKHYDIDQLTFTDNAIEARIIGNYKWAHLTINGTWEISEDYTNAMKVRE